MRMGFSHLLLTGGLLCVSVLLGGCTTPSLNTLATDDTTIVDQGVIGSWTEDLGNETYVVTPTENARVCRLTLITHDQDSPTIEAELRLVKLGEVTFADLWPTPHQIEMVGKAHGPTFMPVHVFAKIQRDGDTLKASELSSDWLKDSLRGGSQVLTHSIVDSEVVITAPTSELQTFITHVAPMEKAWTKAKTLKRLTLSDPKAKHADPAKK